MSRQDGSPDVLAGMPALPLEFGDARARAGLHRQPPGLGEHSRAVLAEAGFTAGEIDALATEGVLG